jgi:hypothetical protein
MPSNRADGADDQNNSGSIDWPAKREKTPAGGEVFFLDFFFYRG